MTDLRTLLHPDPDSPGGRAQIESSRRFAAWRRHFLPAARAEIKALVDKGEYHPDSEREAGYLAGYMAIGPTQSGEWPAA